MSLLSKILCESYRYAGATLRSLILKIACRVEGGELRSRTLREIYKLYHDVDVGMYTQGFYSSGCLIDRHTKIGRYCSLSMNVRIVNRNHPLEYKSTHALFFNPVLGLCDKDLVEYKPLEIGNDVWIGHAAIIQPHVRKIGDGAVIGAGAVVNKDVPPYAIVVGNPSRVVRYRFSKEVIEELLASHWWEKSPEELRPQIDEFRNFLNAPAQGGGEGE